MAPRSNEVKGFFPSDYSEPPLSVGKALQYTNGKVPR